jgi:serine/threonine protein kinase
MYGAKRDAAVKAAREANMKYTGKEDDKDIEARLAAMIIKDDVWDYYDEGDALGEGAYGKVVKVTRFEESEDGTMPEDGEYAIKTIFNNDGSEALGREVQVMLEANHPNLVKVHEVYQTPGDALHLVMDIVEPVDDLAQSDLFEWIMTKGALSTQYNCKLLYQTCSALVYLNQCENCIHRDLKPENILIGQELFDRIRVTDYGLARIFPEGLGDEETKAGTANVGSNGYQAPETINEFGDKTMYGKECDMFSLGVIMYICCVAAPPFGLGPSARVHDLKAGNFKPMNTAKWAKVPQELKDIVVGLLKPDPAERLSAKDILANAWVKEQAGIPMDLDGIQAALEADLIRAASN